MRVTPLYTSIGTNRSSSCAACTSSGVLAFGAGQHIALWDTESTKGVSSTLPGHRGHINALKFLSDDRILSGDSKGEIRIWKEHQSEVIWQAHQGASISALGSIGNLVFTGASDGNVSIWTVEKDKVESIQTIDLKGKLPLDIEAAYLPGTQVPILVLGLTDRRIRIYTLKDGEFAQSLSLEGHEDWVRCLSFTSYPSPSNSSADAAEGEDLLLASGSQDNFVRLWRVSPVSNASLGDTGVDAPAVGEGQGDGLDLLDEFERRLNGESGNTQISTKAHVLAVQSGERTLRFDITLEALLVGHESGLTNIHWSPPSAFSSGPLLLSTATDNSLIIWAPSAGSHPTDGIWIPEHRFGAVGGRGLAFYGAIWGKDGNSVMAGGWNGGWERWVRDDEEEDTWEVRAGLNGHFREVQSIVWDPRGEYLLSVSSDQTSRIHAPSTLPSSSSASKETTWAEIARPQIHGYDMTSAAFISPLRFVSGADEKVTRIFDAPEGFVSSLKTLGVLQGEEGDRGEGSSRPKGATVPPLRLSNRALQKAPAASDVVEKQGMNEAIISISHTLTSLPTEEELATSTLWPEVEKVYGHGYEIVSVTSSHNGKYIATACRASNVEHASIRIVSTESWELVGEPLKGHSLTITRMAFSSDDKRLLSVSRDRGWRIWQLKENGEEGGYDSLTMASEEKAHSRMVLDGCWIKGTEVFATASRDKTVKIWQLSTEAESDGKGWKSTSIKLPEGITSIDCINRPRSSSTLNSTSTSDSGEEYLLAIGTESGNISIHSVNIDREGITTHSLIEFDHSIAHALAVNRLAWRPAQPADATKVGEPQLQLASCGDDRSVRVYDISLE